MSRLRGTGSHRCATRRELPSLLCKRRNGTLLMLDPMEFEAIHATLEANNPGVRVSECIGELSNPRLFYDMRSRLMTHDAPPNLPAPIALWWGGRAASRRIFGAPPKGSALVLRFGLPPHAKCSSVTRVCGLRLCADEVTISASRRLLSDGAVYGLFAPPTRIKCDLDLSGRFQ